MGVLRNVAHLRAGQRLNRDFFVTIVPCAASQTSNRILPTLVIDLYVRAEMCPRPKGSLRPHLPDLSALKIPIRANRSGREPATEAPKEAKAETF